MMPTLKLSKLRPESGELLGLDALRFIAAMGIVVGHAIGRTDTFSETDTQPIRLFVDLFFLISGYVIAHVYLNKLSTLNDYYRFLVKRVARLVPLHWLTLLVFVFIGLFVWFSVVHIDDQRLYDPSCLIPNFLLIHSVNACSNLSYNAPSWSISAEAAMYVFTPIIFWIARLRVFSWVLLVALFLTLSLVPGEPWHSWTSGAGALRALPSFLFGMLLYRERDLVRKLPHASLITFLSIAAFVVGVFLKAPDLVLLIALYCAGISAVAGDVSGTVSRPLRVLAPLGQLTYSIYMIHYAWLLVTVSFISKRILGLEGVALDIVVLLSVISVIGISYLSYQLFERPSRRMITQSYDRWMARREPRVTEQPVD